MAPLYQRHVVKTTQSSTCRNASAHDNDVDVNAPTSRINGSVHWVTDCEKNPGHENFIPIHNLKPDNLLRVFRGLGHIYIDLIRLKSHETVKLEVAYTSPKRPYELGFKELKGKSSLRNGSGTVFVLNMENEQPCPFSDCSEHQGPHSVSGTFKVMTAGHVVYDDDEAQQTKITFFYDDENDTSKLVFARGVRISSIDVVKNRSVIECVTHDLTLCEKLKGFRVQRESLFQELKKQQHLDNEKTDRMVVLISHPHGYAKHVTIGRLIQLVKYENKVQVEGINLVSCQLSYTTPTCPGSGGGSVNIFDSKVGCIGFAPHGACREKHKEGISGLGWTLVDREQSRQQRDPRGLRSQRTVNKCQLYYKVLIKSSE